MADKKTKTKAKRFGQPGAAIVSKRSRLRKGVEVKKKPTGPRKRSPMEKDRVLSTMKSKAQELGGNVRSGEEMEAEIKGLKTLTNEGPGRLKLALKGGGRAYGKNS